MTDEAEGREEGGATHSFPLKRLPPMREAGARTTPREVPMRARRTPSLTGVLDVETREVPLQKMIAATKISQRFAMQRNSFAYSCLCTILFSRLSLSSLCLRSSSFFSSSWFLALSVFWFFTSDNRDVLPSHQSLVGAMFLVILGFLFFKVLVSFPVLCEYVAFRDLDSFYSRLIMLCPGSFFPVSDCY